MIGNVNDRATWLRNFYHYRYDQFSFWFFFIVSLLTVTQKYENREKFSLKFEKKRDTKNSKSTIKKKFLSQKIIQIDWESIFIWSRIEIKKNRKHYWGFYFPALLHPCFCKHWQPNLVSHHRYDTEKSVWESLSKIQGDCTARVQQRWNSNCSQFNCKLRDILFWFDLNFKHLNLDG